MRTAVTGTALIVGALTLSPTALAQDVDAPADDQTTEPAESDEADGEDQDSDQRSESKGPWKPRPYLSPIGSAVLYSNGQDFDVGLLLGLEAGLKYKQENGMLQGRTRLAGAIIPTTGGGGVGFGTDVRGGTFMGVRPKLYGAELGLDIFRNAYDGNAVTLAPTTGVDFPSIRVELGPHAFHLLGGITPTWLGETSRQVNWSEQEGFGFGHEFEWRAGASINAGIALSATYYERTLASGKSQGLAFGLGIGF